MGNQDRKLALSRFFFICLTAAAPGGRRTLNSFAPGLFAAISTVALERWLGLSRGPKSLVAG